MPDTMKENRSILRNMFVKFWEATDKDNTLNVYRGKIKSFHTQRNTNDINQAFQQCLNLEESFRILLAAKVTIHKFSEIRRKPFSNMLGPPDDHLHMLSPQITTRYVASKQRKNTKKEEN